jgi:GMP reductase
MLINDDVKLDYSDVLIRPKRSTLKSRKEVDLFRTTTFRNSKRVYSGIPIMSANMDGVGTFKMADELAKLNIFTCLVKTYKTNELVEFFDCSDLVQLTYRKQNVAMSIGTSDDDMKKFRNVYELTDGKVKYLCVDVANGYTEMFSDFIYQLRLNHPELVIIAGNVVTGDMTQELILNGADIIKVGIGPGSVCTTRIQTGVGYPQLSAVMECADAAHGLGGHIVADGGCTSSGDIAKGFGGGSDFVMLGGMLAGHDEGGGEIITKTYELNELLDEGDGYFAPIYDKKQFVQFYGMSSETANDKHFGGLKDYRASEGKEVNIPYKGNVASTIQSILGGIRSSCTYIGAGKIKDLPKCTTFVRVNNTHNRIYE